MSTLSDEEIQQILDEQLPGHIVVSPPPSTPHEEPGRTGGAPPEADTPDMEAIRRKYLGTGPEIAAGAQEAVSAEDQLSTSPGDTVVWVRPAGQVDELAPGPGPKAVVIASDTKKIVGMQG